jgi:cytochrome bd-type quinol oxidase subunit 2
MPTSQSDALLKQILLAKTHYLYLIIGVILSSVIYYLITFLNIFIWWFSFGEGADSDERNHPVAAQLYAISPLIIIYIICCLLIYKSLQADKLSRVKSLLILMVVMVGIHFLRYPILSSILNTSDLILGVK